MTEIVIYSPIKTNRLEYILSFIFTNVANINWKLVTNINNIDSTNNIIINYSTNEIKDSLQIIPYNILFETDINKKPISVNSWDDIPILFANNNNLIPFDIFSAVFYLISRYEEYISDDFDKHGRFKAINSIAFKYSFLERPIVDEWIYKFFQIIIEKYPKVKNIDRKYKFISTIDIDNAYAFKHKNIYRKTAAFVKSLIKIDITEIKTRVNVFAKNITDPYDNYLFIKQIHDRHMIKPIFFILCSKYGKYDKNISYKSHEFKRLLKDLSDFGKIGLHPSYNASEKNNISSEKNLLSNILGKDIIISRQHFLKMYLPKTYKMLNENGIKSDFSMGYSSHIGFRAGTCTPFKFFDLQCNKELDILIHPFQIIDVALLNTNKSTEQAIIEIQNIISIIKKVNGLFIPIWHNESLGNYKRWHGWKQVYEEMINLAVEKQKIN